MSRVASSSSNSMRSTASSCQISNTSSMKFTHLNSFSPNYTQIWWLTCRWNSSKSL